MEKFLTSVNPVWWVVLFIAVITLFILVVVLFNHASAKRKWERAEKDSSRDSLILDLGTNTTARMQYLETTNERLVRENEGWRGRCKEILLHLEDRDRKLEASRTETGVTAERARLAEERCLALAKENAALRVDAKLTREPISVERPYDVTPSGGGSSPRGQRTYLGPIPERGNQVRDRNPRIGGNLADRTDSAVRQGEVRDRHRHEEDERRVQGGDQGSGDLGKQDIHPRPKRPV